MPVTSTSGETQEETGPTGTPAKRTLPFKRGVRRGDVLLMVAKLDPELAKPEQKIQPHETPKDKTPAPAKDAGGAKKGAPRGTPCGPQAPVPEKTKTGVVADTGQGTRGGKCQGSEGKGSQDPQTSRQKEAESQSTEEQGTRAQTQGAGNKGQLGTAEKGGDSPKKMERAGVPKDSGTEVRPAQPPVPIRKWGGSLGQRSKGEGAQSKTRESESQGSRDEKMGALLSLAGDRSCVQPAESRGQQQEAPGKVERTGRPQKNLVAPGKGQELPGVAVVTQSPEESCKAPDGVPTEGASLAGAARREGHPDSRVLEAQEPCAHTEEEVNVVKPQAEGHIESNSKTGVGKDQEELVLQDPGRGGQSGDSDQVRCGPWSLRVEKAPRGGRRVGRGLARGGHSPKALL